MEAAQNLYLICNECGDTVPSTGAIDEDLTCKRCGHHFSTLKTKSVSATLALSATALILAIPANTLPFMSMELYGIRTSATIWEGVVQLAEGGSWFIALVVLVASIVIPIIKLAILFFLSLKSSSDNQRLVKTRLFRFVETIGRWSMLDIYLLAVLVAIMKLGPWTTVEPGPGAVMFALVVIFTMLASSSFHSRLLWRGRNADLKV